MTPLVKYMGFSVQSCFCGIMNNKLNFGFSDFFYSELNHVIFNATQFRDTFRDNFWNNIMFLVGKSEYLIKNDMTVDYNILNI